MISKFCSIIPARSGSKGIPNKNISPLGGKPLLQWTIEASLGSEFISETIVSSDSSGILNLSESLGATCHERGPELSSDIARTGPVVLNVLKEIKHLRENFEYLILLQPTSPLRTSQHIDQACNKILDSNADTLISVIETPNGILKTLIENEDGGLKTGFNKDFPFMPRQELPKTFIPNGAIYISKIEPFIKNISFLLKNNSFYVMNQESSYDIDTLEDLQIVEKIIKNNKFK